MSVDPAPEGAWQDARIVAIRDETANAKTFRLALPRPTNHAAGQHYIVRLTAEDGYSASRSYSVASAPDGGDELELTVERLEDGEVSSFLHDVVEVGDEIEVRGPIGGWFVWDATSPALLVGGGSGIVPLMAMLRLARQQDRSDLVRLVVSVRTPGELYYADELPGPETSVLYTREAPDGHLRPPMRIARDDVVALMDPDAVAYVCGSSGFCDATTDILIGIGVAPERIRVERFGPTQ